MQNIGRNFGGYVTHEVGRYVYFYIGQKGFLIWSTVSNHFKQINLNIA